MAKFYDTMIGEYIKNPGVRGIGLDALADKQLDYSMQSYDSVTNKGKIAFQKVALTNAANYSAEDVYITQKLYQKQKEEQIIEDTVLQTIELPLMLVLQKMEANGVKISRDKLKEIGILLENEIQVLEKKVYEQAGEEFNINSPKQVGEILFEKLALPKGKKTKTGWSVSADVLGNLAHEYPIAQMIVDYRHYSKLLSTYVDGLLDLLDENDLLHTNFNQTVTATGRLSSTKPNLQNIPNAEGIAGEIRGAFISRFEKGSILAIDYSQIEVRILSILSEDEALISAFENNHDIHHTTAEFLFPKETITSSKRKIAKAVNFGVIYGISGFGLSKMIDISVADANTYIKKFFESYPKVKELQEQIIKNCEESGFVETIFGRKRFIPGINDRNKMLKSAAEREAINMPIQGSNADIIKLAMIQVQQTLEDGQYQTKMIMQVHDELVFDVFPGEEQKIQSLVKEIMETIYTHPRIVLLAESGIGENWKEAK